MTSPADDIEGPVTDPERAAALLRGGMSHQRAGALDEAMVLFRRVAASPNPEIASAGWRQDRKSVV